MNAVSGVAAQNACPVTEAARVNTASSIAVIRVLYPTIKASPPAISRIIVRMSTNTGAIIPSDVK